MPLFVISFVFGQTLEYSIFAEICLFRRNLPLSCYNRHLSRFSSLSPYLSFCQTFDGFLANSPFSQFANFLKSPTVNIAGFFGILFEYLAIPLMNFWHTRHFCRNFPSSTTICHFLTIAICHDFPLCHLIWGFARPLMDSCPVPHFLQFAIFVKIANCREASFVVSFKCFARPLLNPCQVRQFRKMSFLQDPQLSTCLIWKKLLSNFPFS